MTGRPSASAMQSDALDTPIMPMPAPYPTMPQSALPRLLPELIRRRRMIATCGAVGCVLALGVSLVLPSMYTAETTFTPEVSSSSALSGSLAGLAGLAGLASQLQLSPASLSGASPDFFAQVVHSREVLKAALDTPFPDPNDPAHRPRRLMDLLDVSGKTPRDRLERAIKKLGKRVDVAIDRRTGIITLSVKQRSPTLAAGVANRVVELVNELNLQRRQVQSRQQRQFLARRLDDAQRALGEAEQQHLRFLEQNRRYQESPSLDAEAARLERQVQLKQEVFLSLTKSVEEARIAELRDTPMLSVIDSAEPPYRRSSPRLFINTVLGLLIGLTAGIWIAVLPPLSRRPHRVVS